jgi:hypothetical protein
MTADEAISECVRRGLGPSACADLVWPYCDGSVQMVSALPPPHVRCAPRIEVSPRKAAILLAEAEARASSDGPPWLLVGVGVAAIALGAWVTLRR